MASSSRTTAVSIYGSMLAMLQVEFWIQETRFGMTIVLILVIREGGKQSVLQSKVVKVMAEHVT